MSNNAVIGVGIGLGALILGGGAAFAIASYINSKKAQPVSTYEPRPVLNIITPPSRIIGRPFSDPFYSHYGGSSLWGSGPWAHRSPRMRPVTPNFGPPHH